MKQLGQQPRASWFPVIIVGAPSCQTDLLFTKDPVNQKSPSKAFSLNNCVRGIRVFWKRWGVMSWLEQSWLNWESQFKAMTILGPLTRWWTNAEGWVPMSCVHVCILRVCRRAGFVVTGNVKNVASFLPVHFLVHNVEAHFGQLCEQELKVAASGRKSHSLPTSVFSEIMSYSSAASVQGNVWGLFSL